MNITIYTLKCSQVLEKAGIRSTYVYSSLDALARKQHMARFRGDRRGACSVLVVTDVAARGLDIPVLDNVINLNTPARAKLFVHRVGRVCRTRASAPSDAPGGGAGRQTPRGTAYTFVASDELSHLLDLHLFLDRELLPVRATTIALAHESTSISADRSNPSSSSSNVDGAYCGMNYKLMDICLIVS